MELFFVFLAIQIVFIVGVIFFLKNYLAKRLVNATSHLHQLNQDYTDKLDDAKKRQAEADRYYDEIVRKTKGDAEAQKVQLLKEAHEQTDAIVGDARKAADEILLQANKAKESMLREFQETVYLKAISLAGELTHSILSKESTKILHDQWMKEMLASGIEELSRLNLPDEITQAQLTVAHELSADEKKQIQKKISECAKRNIALMDVLDSALIAGFRIQLGSVTIDGSLKSKVEEAVRHGKHNGA